MFCESASRAPSSIERRRRMPAGGPFKRFCPRLSFKSDSVPDLIWKPVLYCKPAARRFTREKSCAGLRPPVPPATELKRSSCAFSLRTTS